MPSPTSTPPSNGDRKPPPPLEHERLRLLAATQAQKYSLLLATVLDEALPVENKHNYDARYRTLVDHHTHVLLTENEIPHQRVTSAPDSQAHAMERALQLCLNQATPRTVSRKGGTSP